MDGGGTRTRCLIADESRILARSTAGSSNIVRVGEAAAVDALRQAALEACDLAGITPPQIARGCIGAAGAAVPAIATTLQRIIAGIGIGDIDVVGDMEIALRSAFGGAAGVVAIAGTGSIVYGRNAKGATARAGGHGFAISDEGSAQWIGRTAVSAALRARDEGTNPPLLNQLLHAWQCAGPDQFVLAANASSANFALLAPTICAAADSGDALASDVLARAGAELGALVGIVARRLFSASTTVPVAMSGGVFANCGLVRETFSSKVREQITGAVINSGLAEPINGALQIARQGFAGT